jgi:hypothetical protein
MASLEEVWGGSFPKKKVTQLPSGLPVRERDMEPQVFSNPTRRTEYAMQKHKKTIDDLTAVLPIAQSEGEIEHNFYPAPPTKQKKNDIEPFQTQYAPIYGGKPKSWENMMVGRHQYAYEPPMYSAGNSQLEAKIDRVLRMVDQNKTGYETPSANDMLLYIFTGLFFMFTMDTFVQIGRKMR